MDEEHVAFASRGRVSLSALPALVSADVYQTELHVRVCQTLASSLCADDRVELQGVLTNLLFLKSARARAITALLWWASAASDDDVLSVHCCDDVLVALSSVAFGGATESQGVFRGSYVDRSHAHLLALKAFAHRLFRLLQGRSGAGPVAVRAWVEVSQALYPEQFRTGDVLVYPFPLNPVRQIRFVHECRQSHVRFRLAGVPYSFAKVVKCLLTTRRDRLMAVAELDAYAQHASELVAGGIRSLYTSDEYEVAAFALHRRLSEAGVHVVNTAHGVGVYCPYVRYHEFHAYTQEQGDFYARRDQDMTIRLRNVQNRTVQLGTPPNGPRRAAVVLVHQPFDEFGQIAGGAVQDAIASQMNAYAGRRGIDVLVKVHPNTRPRGAERLRQRWGLPLLYRWNELDGLAPVFLIMNSTAYFELRGVAPVLVYEDGSFAPWVYFGQGYQRFTLATLETRLDEVMATLADDASIRPSAPAAGAFVGGAA